MNAHALRSCEFAFSSALIARVGTFELPDAMTCPITGTGPPEGSVLTTTAQS
jgi:hypothetical protein